MQRRREQWLTAAIVGVMLLTFVLVVYLPQRRQIAQLRQDRKATTESLERDKAKAMELAQIQGEVKQMTDRLAFFNQRLPDEEELGQFVHDVSSYAQGSGLKDVKYTPRAVEPGELYVRMPIEMTCRGTFADLFRFLRQTKSMTRLTHMQGLGLTNDAKLSGECNVKMELMIYFTRG